MEETYRLLIDFKTLHPIRFWTVIFIATSLIIVIIWRLSKNKRKAKIAHQRNQRRKSKVVAEHESVKLKLETKEQNRKFKIPETKVYSDTSVKEKLEVKEPKSIYAKSTDTKQEKVIPKVEKVEVKPKSKEELPKSKEEITKSKNKFDFVNYDITKVPTTDLYPVFRFPKKGTVVRSYRLGNTKRRGYKEESFQKSIEQYFGKDFTVLGNARLNTGKETRPFEPDIAIIDKSSSNRSLKAMPSKALCS